MRTARLGDIARVFNGNSISAVEKDKHYRGMEGTPYIGTAEVGFDTKIEYDSGVGIPNSRIQLFKIAKPGTPLVCAEGGSAGRKVGYLDREICFGNKLFAIEPNAEWDGKLLFYFCLSDAFREQFRSFTTGLIGGVSIKKFKEIEVPHFPLEEQRRLVAVLDEAFAAIATATANTEKNLANARELIEVELTELFGVSRPGWLRSKLGSVLSVQSGFAFRSADYVDEGHFLVRIGNVQSDQLTLKNPKYVQLDHKTEKFALQSGDILTSLTGNIGRVAAVRESDLPAALNQRVARLIPCPNSGLATEFLLLFLKSDHFRLKLEAMGHGAAQLNVSPKAIGEVEFDLPDESTQKDILGRFALLQQDVGKLTATYEKKLVQLPHLKESLLHLAFTGELTEREPLAA